ncbi:hypothetical protein CWT02_4884 [Salmonella enterica subsp. enterica serovar Cubana]|uniref:Uncharacterized protein n=1 Tax=Salmonella enterica subsp. enterica serovar Cubana str. 76814 TaxID=1192560 RepID=V7IJ63_SALET|nr:hypothetical protein A628_04106 [Salmonella enterica subsp. enterica serovar Cubana str. 76814]PQB13749.1 hypothetical protein CWT02_4884 [Salmonella enterica subsp. enterica serovar Cubana]
MEDDKPALRETAASEVPFFLNPAMMSAGCQSLSIISIILVL